MRRDSTREKQRGVVLILAIFAVVLLTVLAVAITAVARVELLASRSALRRLQSLFLAEAGLHQARALLLYEDQTVDTLRDVWGPEYERALDLPRKLGSGFYRVRVYDASGRINVNRSDYETLFRLTGDPMLAAAIIDWRDRGSGPRAGGAEWDYYAALHHPYAPRNGPFQTAGELLLVRGMTPEVFFSPAVEERPLRDLVTVESESLNTDANGEMRLNLNSFRNWSEQAFQDYVMAKLGAVLTSYDAEQIWRGMTTLPNNMYTSVGQLATAAGLDFDKIAGIVDYVTVADGLVVPGRVNVNTAPEEVLAALPGSSAQLAEIITARRDEEPFVSLAEVALLLLTEGGGPVVFGAVIDRLTTKSSTFIVESMGYTEEGGYRTIRSLVRRDDDGVEILQQAEEDRPLPPVGELY